MRAEGVALLRIERALQRGAEDGGFDLRPVGLGGFDEQRDVLFG